MSKVAYLVRHGQHGNNVLTPAGIARMQAAANAIKTDLMERGASFDNVRVYSSQEPRAVMSAGVLAASLGLKITSGQLEAFNPAAGLGKAIQEKRLPNVGEGFAKQWREQGCEGVEDFRAVQQRAWLALLQLAVGGDMTLIVATHGGVIEPCVDSHQGADCHDLVEGEVAVVEHQIEEPQATVHFLNAKLPE